MNKKANMEAFGMFLFFGALAFYVFYMLKIYLPIANINPFQEEVFMNALIVGFVCGIVGTIGLLLAKR